MESLTLLDIVKSGGILIVPIFICSIIVVAVAVERYLTYRRLTINVPQLMMKLRHPLSTGDITSAINECSMVKGPVTAVVRAGLEKVKYGREHMKEAMEAAGNIETYHLEKNLSVLATLAGVTPLIGFLGTVTGMIKAFMKIQQLAGNVNADVLAGGIWEAMVTTAAGLSVGIPAMIAYNYYINRVRGFIYQMETVGDEVVDIVTRDADAAAHTQPKQAPAAAPAQQAPTQQAPAPAPKPAPAPAPEPAPEYTPEPASTEPVTPEPGLDSGPQYFAGHSFDPDNIDAEGGAKS